eukprot:gene31437-38829_t
MNEMFDLLIAKQAQLVSERGGMSPVVSTSKSSLHITATRQANLHAWIDRATFTVMLLVCGAVGSDERISLLSIAHIFQSCATPILRNKNPFSDGSAASNYDYHLGYNGFVNALVKISALKYGTAQQLCLRQVQVHLWQAMTQNEVSSTSATPPVRRGSLLRFNSMPSMSTALLATSAAEVSSATPSSLMPPPQSTYISTHTLDLATNNNKTDNTIANTASDSHLNTFVTDVLRVTLGKISENPNALDNWIDLYAPILQTGSVFHLLTSHHTLLLTTWKRGRSYGLAVKQTTSGGVRGTKSHPVTSNLSPFEIYCMNHNIVNGGGGGLVSGSVVRRISQYV